MLGEHSPRLVDVEARLRRDEIRGRDLVDGDGVRVTTGCQYTRHEIAVGDDGDDALPLHDGERTLLCLDHHLGGIDDARPRLDRDDVRRHDVSDLRHLLDLLSVLVAFASYPGVPTPNGVDLGSTKPGRLVAREGSDPTVRAARWRIRWRTAHAVASNGRFRRGLETGTGVKGFKMPERFMPRLGRTRG